MQNKRTVLIVLAHPEGASYCGQLKETLKDMYLTRGFDVLESNLYQDNFQPLDRPTDFNQRANANYFDTLLEQAHAQKTQTVASDVKTEQDKVLKADEIVFIAPLMWQNIPAMMQGWLERVLSAGFAYDNNQRYNTSPLQGRTAKIIVTTGGSLGILNKDKAAQKLRSILAPLKDRPFAYCGIDLEKIIPIIQPTSFKQPELRAAEIKSVCDQIVFSSLRKIERPKKIKAEPKP